MDSAHFYDGVDVRLFIFLVTLPIALNVIYVFYGGSRPALDFRAKTVLVWFDLWARGIGGGLLLRARTQTQTRFYFGGLVFQIAACAEKRAGKRP